MNLLQLSSKIIWVAGILEGEGCFNLHKGKYARIQLEMCDLDIIQRIRDIMDPSTNIRIKKYEKINHNTAYVIVINGQLAIEWMMTIYCLMGNRRKEKIREIIQGWKSTGIMSVGDKTFLAKRKKQIETIMNIRNIPREEAEKILLEQWGRDGGTIQ